MPPSRYAKIRRQASSDVPEIQHYGDSGAGRQSSVTSSSHNWALKDYKSSSTLKSFYDPDKLPLPISQQTSESAIRDMALRKGKPIVVGKRVSTGGRDELLEDAARKYCASAADSESTATTITKRPPRLDMSRLFGRSNTTLNVTSPSSSIMESPSAMSYSSEHFNQQSPHFGQHATNSIASSMKSPMSPHPANPVKSPAMSNSSNGMRSPMMNSGSKLRKARPSTSSLKMAYQNRFLSINERSAVKQNIYRPPQGAKNWFDGLLEEEDEFDEELETEASTTTTGVLSLSYCDLELDTQVEKEYPNATDHFSPPVEDHFNLHDPTGFIIDRGQAQRESRREMDYISSRPSTLKSAKTSASPLSLALPQSSVSPMSRRSSRTSRTSRTRHSSRNRESILANSDLGDTSVLSLSSSDGESEDGDSIDSRLPKFRNSIQVSDIDSIVIAEAQAFRISGNRPAKTTEEAVQRRRESVASNVSILSISTAAETSSIHSSITGPTYLAVPSRKDRPRRSRHTRQPSLIPEDLENNKPTPPSSSLSSPSNSRSSIPGNAESMKSEPRKMMAVTEEEEALLEMMRSKRAAMVKDSVSDQNRAVKKPVSSPASSTSRSTRANRPTSTSSSILDSFPISRSQRSSLMAANLGSNSQPDLLNAVNASAGPTAKTNTRTRVDSSQQQSSVSAQTRPTLDTGVQPDSSHQQEAESTQSQHTLGVRARTDSSLRQRSRSSQSRAMQQSKRTSTTSSINSRLENSYSAFPPHLSLASFDINLSPIRASMDARSPSPEPFSIPTTPQTRRGSADVLIRPTPSQRNSLASFGHLVYAMEHTLYSDAGGEIDDVTSFNKDTQRQSRPRRASSKKVDMLRDSGDEDEEEFTIYTGTATKSPIAAVTRKSVSQQPRYRLEKREKAYNKPQATVHATSAAQAENLGYMWERESDNFGLSFVRNARLEKVGSASTRCSVSEDVLAAWGSLGGWRDVIT
ncbi:hypothetical protein E2P81_ATG08191 [Venturia nashicola]|nr:hypothetical protein E2P81_ATG08191 [Venturia nashicola]